MLFFSLGSGMQDLYQQWTIKPSDDMLKPFYSAQLPSPLQGGIQSELLKHELSKLYKYKCDECGKFFTSNWELRRHSTSHSGIKAFVCDLCNKRYTRKENLVLHKKSVHNALFYE